MSVDERTVALYDARASEYASRFGKVDAPSKSQAIFLERLPEGGRILDLGCGPGMSALKFQKAGFEVDPVDASEGMIAVAREAGLPARVATFDDVDEVAAYDGVWANFSLLHAAREDLPRYLAAIARALRPGGVLHIGMKLGEGTERDGIDRRYTYVTRAELEGLIAPLGFEICGAKEFEEEGFAGTLDPCIVMLWQKTDG